MRESQNLEKLQNLEKCIFCCFAGGPQRYPTLSVLIPNPGKLQNLNNAFFAGFREGPNAIQRYPSLSQTLEKLQNLEKCFFAGLRGGGGKTGKNCKTWKNVFFVSLREGPQRYPTLSVIIPDPKKIAKLGKMHFLLVSGKGSTLSNAIQRYPSLSQTLEKFQNLEKSIFCCFVEKCIFLVSGKASTLSNAIRPYPRP